MKNNNTKYYILHLQNKRNIDKIFFIFLSISPGHMWTSNVIRGWSLHQSDKQRNSKLKVLVAGRSYRCVTVSAVQEMSWDWRVLTTDLFWTVVGPCPPPTVDHSPPSPGTQPQFPCCSGAVLSTTEPAPLLPRAGPSAHQPITHHLRAPSLSALSNINITDHSLSQSSANNVICQQIQLET